MWLIAFVVIILAFVMITSMPQRPAPVVPYHNPAARPTETTHWAWKLTPICILLSACGWCYYTVQPSVGHSATTADCPVAGLPVDARNINYHIGGLEPFYAYEFDVPLQSFLEWADSNGWRVLPFDEPVEVRELSAQGAPRTILVTRGYNHFWSDLNRGDNSRTIVYDSVRSRVYLVRGTR